MVKKQNKQNSSYRILVGIICKDSVGGILFILLFDHFMNKKPSKNCPKMAIFGQNWLFCAKKWKIGPKSKFHFQHFLEVTYSCFLAIIGLPSTIFVKVDQILRFWPNFHKIAIFAKNSPENGQKFFFVNFAIFARFG